VQITKSASGENSQATQFKGHFMHLPSSMYMPSGQPQATELLISKVPSLQMQEPLTRVRKVNMKQAVQTVSVQLLQVSWQQ
jgi:hypothetical protein